MSEIREMTFRGRKFKVRKGSTHPEYSFFCFEADEADFREKYWHPKEGDVVVDAGASYGAYTLTALAMGAHVEAYEPERSVFVDLVANMDLNADDMNLSGWASNFDESRRSSKCNTWQLGLWDDDCEVDMASYAPHWPPGTITGPFRMARLDRSRMKKLDWLKIDVEGCEDRVLRGAVETLNRCKPRVIVESHIFLDAELTNKCRSILESCGYTDFEVVQREPCEFLIARPA